MKTVPGLALLGGIAAAAVQPFTPTGWWLNSGQGVAITAIALAAVAAIVAAVAIKRPFGAREAAAVAALWGGANIGMAVMLFRAGPGTIFPIVLAMGAGISALAVGAGSLLGSLLAAGLARANRRGAG
jgi:hypothetical protein